MLRLPIESLNFVDRLNPSSVAPRTAETFREIARDEGRKEFESGHLGANSAFPAGYMKEVWNIARYIGVRESFIDEWNPQRGYRDRFDRYAHSSLFPMAVLAGADCYAFQDLRKNGATRIHKVWAGEATGSKDF